MQTSLIERKCEIMCSPMLNGTNEDFFCCWSNVTYKMSGEIMEPPIVAPRTDECYVYSYIAFILSILANTGLCYYGTTNRYKNIRFENVNFIIVF